MIGLILKSVAIGIAVMAAVPAATFAIVLGLSHLLDGRCGTPGDSGGCEMGAATIALATVVPGFLIGFFVPLVIGLRRRKGAGSR